MNRIYRLPIAIALCGAVAFNTAAQRSSVTLRDWQFTKDAPSESAKWQNVTVPHDWAIYGPFDRENDLQRVAVEQNGEKEETVKTGRTGGLPFIGKGSYRTTFNVADTVGKDFTLIFDGAMSNPVVTVNGEKAGIWRYGYNTFYLDIDSLVKPGVNDLLVELENHERASRWYPGAGLYRNVHLVTTDKVHVPVWGTYVTTPDVDRDRASVRLETSVEGLKTGQKGVTISTEIIDPQGNVVADDSTPYYYHGQPYVQNFLVNKPQLWSPESPSLYTARTKVASTAR